MGSITGSGGGSPSEVLARGPGSLKQKAFGACTSTGVGKLAPLPDRLPNSPPPEKFIGSASIPGTTSGKSGASPPCGGAPVHHHLGRHHGVDWGWTCHPSPPVVAPPSTIIMTSITRQALSRAHTSSEAADHAKLLLLNKLLIKRAQFRDISLGPS